MNELIRFVGSGRHLARNPTTTEKGNCVLNKVALSFGEALIDFRRDDAGQTTGLPAFVAHPGGAPANVAVTLAKLGARSAFMGMLSRDFFGELLWTQMSAAGVDLSYVERTAHAKTALAFVDNHFMDQPAFTFYRQSTADLLFRARHFQEKAFAKAAVFHVCSNSLTESRIANATLSGMRRARTRGALVSFDMNLRRDLWQLHQDPMPRLLDAFAIADLVKLSAEEFRFVSGAVGGEAIFFSMLWQHAPRLLVVTNGPEPVRWFTPDEQGVQAVIPVTPVDPTGAGDAFMGGLLFRLASTQASAQELPAIVRNPVYRDDLLGFSCACGAVAAMQSGSFSAMPTLEAVQSLLKVFRTPP